MAEALYRKYRPLVFEDVVGQEHIENTLKNAIDQDKVSHAYLFTGPRGTGKTTTARLLAKALLCEKGPTSAPDGTCEDCELIAAGEHPDVYELDAASRTGVENVREEIIGRVQFAPTRGRYKIYIIDEVHMLSVAAFNALLKTLEEPPDHVVFILATTDPQKVPETIHSRCQRFDFKRISNEAIVSRLGAVCIAEGVDFDGDALELIAHRAEGGMRDALTSLEQLIALGEGRVTMEVAERMLGALATSDLEEIIRFVGVRDIASCFRWTAAFMETGADLAQFVRDMAERIRNMYVMSLAGADAALDISDTTRRELENTLPLFGSDRLARLLEVLGDLMAELKTSTNPRLSFEIALTRMVRPDSDLTLESLAERIEALEAGHSAVAYVVQNDDMVREISFEDREQLPANGEVASVECVSQAEASKRGSALKKARSEEKDSSQNVMREINAAALQRMWQAAQANLKKERDAYAVLFLNTKIHMDEDGKVLIIEFPADSDFSFTAAQRPQVQDELGAALLKANGAPVSFRLVRASDTQDTTQEVQVDYHCEAQPQKSAEAVSEDATDEQNELSSGDQSVDQGEDAGDDADPTQDDDLDTILAFGFGEGVSFTEVED